MRSLRSSGARATRLAAAQTAQWRDSAGECWGAPYANPLANQAGLFRARE